MPDVALVSGAAQGIGRACVRALRAEGWHVGAIDSDADALGALAEAEGLGVSALHLDVTDPSALAVGVGAFAAGQSSLGACVNAAGIYPMSSLASADLALYRQIFDVNVWGTVAVTQVAAPFLRAGAAVVNFASINAFLPQPEQILYSAAKAAVVSLTRSLAAALAPRGIRVNAVAPGPVATEGMTRLPGRLAQIAADVPLGRAAEAEEIAALVLWLIAGTGAQYITGETIVAGGGLAMR